MSTDFIEVGGEDRWKIEAIHGCRLFPGSWDKRFIRDLHGKMKQCEEAGEPLMLTVKQYEMIDKLRHRYRRQIDGVKV